MYKKIIDEDLPFALIFEDDAIIDNEFYKIYKKIRREKKISWEFLTANYTIFDKSEKTRFSNYLKETYKNQKLQYFKNYILMILATFVDFIFENI
ncbi:MAG: glycosyltransferase family 25 protein [Candidatus Peribacteria bacterium]|nr:glycosyltransferase family 25 protein [Candidatus Peribacteria bacterium]